MKVFMNRWFNNKAASLLLLTLPVSLTASLSLPAKSGSPLPAQPVQQQKFGLRVRPACQIRLGGLFTMGLGEKSSPLEASARLGTKLSTANQKWVGENCDVAAFNHINLTPDTFPAILKEQQLFTGLLHFYATSVYEKDGVAGNVGGWKPAMQEWQLKNRKGEPVKHPDAGGHWMDFDSVDWMNHWKTQALNLKRSYSAYGAVVSELPLGNQYVGTDLSRYTTFEERIKVTGNWLQTVRASGDFLMVPSARGFAAVAGHATLPTPPGTEQPFLPGRLWDDYYPYMDGAFVEGFLRPYWTGEPVSEKEWEISLEAADRASRNDQVYIACGAYHDNDELEYLLASLLLVAHRQGRLVFQPMPLKKGERPDAGFSLQVMQKEVTTKSRYFNLALGFPLQERHPMAARGGPVWRRAFEKGVAYVNSSDDKTIHLMLGAPMLRLDGWKTRLVKLKPHSGVVLLFPNQKQNA